MVCIDSVHGDGGRPSQDKKINQRTHLNRPIRRCRRRRGLAALPASTRRALHDFEDRVEDVEGGVVRSVEAADGVGPQVIEGEGGALARLCVCF